MTQRDLICSRCAEQQAWARGMCQCCYYATRRGYTTLLEKRQQRNFVEDGVGVLTDCAGHRWTVDLDDFPSVSQFLWTDNGSGYAKNGVGEYLHIMLMPGCKSVDHIDRDPFNCSRSNLRDGGGGINALNRPKQPRTQSIYRGVSAMRDKWQARVTCQGERYYLGTFDTEDEAGEAVMAFARRNGRDAFYVPVTL